MEKSEPIILGPDDDYYPAAEIFLAGGVIAYPTETFYGLCVDPFNAGAVEALYRLKDRPPSSPMPLIIGGISMLRFVTSDLPAHAKKLMKRFWPGPLTIVLTATEHLPAAVTAGTGTVAVRLSGNPLARRLSNTFGSPITSTSANPSGKKPPVTAEEVANYFNGSIGMLIDGGKLKGTLGSTIVDASGSELKILREGEIPSSEIFTS